MSQDEESVDINYQEEADEVDNGEAAIEQEGRLDAQEDEKKDIEINQEKKQRKKVDRMTFKPEILLNSKKGLKLLYNRMQNSKYFNQEKIPDEFESLSRLMRYYQEWHFQLIPKYDFNYFIDRCQKFGTQPIIRAHQNRMRKIHRGDLKWEEIEDEIADELQKIQNQKNNEGEVDVGGLGGGLPQLNTQNLNTNNVNSTLIQNIQNQRNQELQNKLQQQQKKPMLNITKNFMFSNLNTTTQRNNINTNTSTNINTNANITNNKNVIAFNKINSKNQAQQLEAEEDLDQLYYQQQNQIQQSIIQEEQGREEFMNIDNPQIINENDNQIIYEHNIDHFTAFPEDFEEIENNLDLERKIKKVKIYESNAENN